MAVTTLEITESLLLNEARAFIKSNRGRLPRLAADCGLPLRFLESLVRSSGGPADPGVRKIERILRYKASLGETLTSSQLR